MTNLLRKEGGLKLNKSRVKNSSTDLPLVSIITVCLNSKNFIEKTIRAVLEQSYPNIELIIIDGASEDGTVDILEKFDHDIDYWLSEKDSGAAEATNKGIAVSKGDYFVILPSNEWLEKDYVERIVQFHKANKDVYYLYGNMVIINDKMETLYGLRGINKKGELIKNECIILSIKKEAFARVGLFNPSYRLANDYDLILRIQGAGFKGAYLDLTRYNQVGGQSQTDWFFCYKESLIVRIKNGQNPIKASLVFLGQISKTCIRVLLEKILSPKEINFLRKKINNKIFDSF